MPNNSYNNFYTAVKQKSSNFPISLDSKILCLGSCFADNLANSLSKNWINISSNPIGISYNPLSLAQQIDMAINHHEFQPQLFEHQHKFYDYRFHGDFSDPEKIKLHENLIYRNKLFYESLEKTNSLVITLGTAFGYFLADKEKQIVNNCHKMPAKNFVRKIIEIDDAFNSLSKTFINLWKINPQINITLTLSPIRHLRDNASENSLSKAVLRVLVEKLIQKFPQQIEYFPAFEIMMDELRDYRFYKSDMCHPSDQAIEYIINYFIKNNADESLNQYIIKSKKLVQDLSHKAINPDSQEHLKFIENTKAKLKLLQQEYPQLQIST